MLKNNSTALITPSYICRRKHKFHRKKRSHSHCSKKFRNFWHTNS